MRSFLRPKIRKKCLSKLRRSFWAKAVSISSDARATQDSFWMDVLIRRSYDASEALSTIFRRPGFLRKLAQIINQLKVVIKEVLNKIENPTEFPGQSEDFSSS